MNKEFVPYEQALALKELGFDEPCFAYYDEEDNTGQIYEYANCSGNVTGDKACYNDNFLSVTNSQLDKYGAFCSKDEEGEESYERWTAPTFSQAVNFLYICSNKQIDIELKASDTYEERIRKITKGCEDLRNLQNNKSN